MLHCIPFLPDFPHPLVFAHRGCSSLAPENTMAAFRRAIEAGSQGIELDIHCCATGELVVIHDKSLFRTTGLNKKVEETPLDELKNLDAGSWFSPAFANEHIPTLEEVLDEFGGKVALDIEIKSIRIRKDPIPIRLADTLHKRGLSRSVVVSSFNPLALAAFKKAAWEFATAIIWSRHPSVPFFLQHGQGSWLSGCDFLKPSYKKVSTLSLAIQALTGGRPFVPWTIDNIELAKKFVRKGCKGIITNTPQDIIPALAGLVQ